MKKAALFLANGFEEIEALGTTDILRRAEISVTTVSVTGDLKVIGAHQIPVIADALFEE
jgi:4-methyl-5(b-hydroxyethyl)-thiazole monophosphate biosynthesis